MPRPASWPTICATSSKASRSEPARSASGDVVLRRAHRRPAEAALWLMGAVTLLAVFGLAIGYRYHLRLEHEFRATDAARHAADQERQRAERLPLLPPHGAGRTRVVGQQHRSSRAPAR